MKARRIRNTLSFAAIAIAAASLAACGGGGAVEDTSTAPQQAAEAVDQQIASDDGRSQETASDDLDGQEMAEAPAASADANAETESETLAADESQRVASGGIYSSTDPSWAAIKRSLRITKQNLSVSVKGTKVNVNNAAVETTSLGRRSFDTGFKIHVPTSSTLAYASRFKVTRWYQEDGNVQVFRLFQGDENVSSSRAGAARSEAFAPNDSFRVANNRINIWSGRFYIASRANEGFSIFQSKATSVSDPKIHNISDAWSVQLNIDDNGRLVINERREADKVVYNVDMTGRGFDAEIRDDGENYEVYIDGVKQASGRFFRHPSLGTTFRWGMYMGKDVVTRGVATTYVSGARVTTKPGRLR
jgi:hypothetical protein